MAKTHPAVERIRNKMQGFAAEHEDLIGLCFFSDGKHDERAILANPSDAFAWVMTTNSTHMVRRAVDATGTHTGRAYLFQIGEAYPRSSPMEFYFWNGTALEQMPSIEALIVAYVNDTVVVDVPDLDSQCRDHGCARWRCDDAH